MSELIKTDEKNIVSLLPERVIMKAMLEDDSGVNNVIEPSGVIAKIRNVDEYIDSANIELGRVDIYQRKKEVYFVDKDHFVVSEPREIKNMIYIVPEEIQRISNRRDFMSPAVSNIIEYQLVSIRNLVLLDDNASELKVSDFHYGGMSDEYVFWLIVDRIPTSIVEIESTIDHMLGGNHEIVVKRFVIRQRGSEYRLRVHTHDITR